MAVAIVASPTDFLTTAFKPWVWHCGGHSAGFLRSELPSVNISYKGCTAMAKIMIKIKIWLIVQPYLLSQLECIAMCVLHMATDNNTNISSSYYNEGTICKSVCLFPSSC